MSEGAFVGRSEELAELARFTQKISASFIVVRGRRRIGKSRLLEEFAKRYTAYLFSGLAPTDKTTAQSQRDEFSRQLSLQTGLPEVKADDWGKLLFLLGEKIKRGRVVVVFDEISWMGSQDSDFLGKIKNAWDNQFKKNPKLIFILCGSASSWIQKNILSHTGFLGRISYTMTVHELALQDCRYFWRNHNGNIAAYEKLKFLSVTGGVPKYLEEMDPRLSAEANIKNLCFKAGGLLVNEFDNIFSDLFLHRTPQYKNIVKALVKGPKEITQICADLNVPQTGLLSEYLNELELGGFIKRDYTWDIKSGQDSKLSKYRLSDNYLRFYLKYIDNYRTKIDRNSFNIKTLTSLPEWWVMLGLQFENLVLNNRKEIHTLLGIRAEDIISENPFFQRKTSKCPGCQIDYMVQTKFNTLYVCEIKFSKNIIGLEIIGEMEEKIKRLKRPKSYSIRPVLIHVNGVSDEVEESSYFSGIINFSSLFTSERA